MDQSILESIIAITETRDSDSLAYSLMASSAEMIPVTSIGLCKYDVSGDPASLEEIIHLDVSQDEFPEGDEDGRYTWQNIPCPIAVDDKIEACLREVRCIKTTSQIGVVRILVPLVSGRECLGLVIFEGGEDIAASDLLAKGMVRIYENYLTLLKESERDNLTNLLNRRTFDKKLSRLLSIQHEKRKQELETGIFQERRRLEPNSHAWLAIIDIDHFKRVNDTYGHVYGDEVLLVFSQKMNSVFRKTDLLFRFGGEEFLVILEPIPEEKAFLALERFRETIASYEFPLVGRVTISIGFAKIEINDYPPTILECADKALYYAKEHGRNQVFHYESLLAAGALSIPISEGSVDLF